MAKPLIMQVLCVNNKSVDTADPLLCPLCQQHNHCVNLGAADTEKTCWCNDPAISFPQALLDQVPNDKKRKACICKTCAQAFKENHGVGVYTPDK